MPNIRFINLLICIFALQACQTFAPQAPSEPPMVDESRLANTANIIVLVETAEEASSLIIEATRRGYHLDEQTALTGLELVMLDFTRPTGINGMVAIRDMIAISPSATAGVEHLYTLQAQTSTSKPRLYAQKMLAWPEKGCDAHLAIGIIDGAIDTANTMFQGHDIIIHDFTKGAAQAEAHGAAVAELLIGPGRLPYAKLYSAFVVSDQQVNEGAGVYELILAIDWMLESDVKVVNFSLAGPYNALLDRAIERAARRGLIIVAAAGNDGHKASPRYPAAFKDVIAVTAIDSAKKIYGDAVRGKHIDFSAPGVDIFLKGHSAGKYSSGTSLAAPFVTAIIASDSSISAESKLSFVRERLASTATDLGPVGYDPIFGNGLPLAPESCLKKPL